MPAAANSIDFHSRGFFDFEAAKTYAIKARLTRQTASSPPWIYGHNESDRMYSFSIRTHIGQTPNCGLPLISSRFSVGQYLHLLEESCPPGAVDTAGAVA